MERSAVALTDRDRRIVQHLVKGLHEALGNWLKQVIVYGSRARGDHEPGSDLDVLVLVSRLDASVKQRIREIRYQVMWEADFHPLISMLCLEEDEFNRMVQQESSLATNIEREGYLIYG